MYNKMMKMYNGVEIPGIALGTWQVPTEDAKVSVETAIRLGYRHIDTAIAYGNETGCAAGIKASGVKREEIFITTKIPAEVKTYEGAKAAIESSLVSLDVDYIDQMIIHCPTPWAEFDSAVYRYDKENIEVWKALEEAYTAGKIRSIGLSNFKVAEIENIMNNCTIKPMVNQLCTFIGNMPEPELEYCAKNNILVTGYSPIATGRLLDQPEIAAIAEKYSVSLPQLCIRYLIERGVLPLPKTVREKYMIANADVNFKISQEDVDVLTAFKDLV